MHADTLPAALRAARQHAGLSLRGLAGRVGLTHQAVQHFEKGRRAVDHFLLARIAAACRVAFTVGPRQRWEWWPMDSLARK